MIEFFLTPLGQSALVFQIESQSDQLTNYVRGRGIFHASNGWKITVDKEPEIDLDNKIIYLQGSNHELDHKVDRHWDLKGKELKEVVKQATAALKEVVEATKTLKKRGDFRIIEVVTINPRYIDPFSVMFRNDPRIVIID